MSDTTPLNIVPLVDQAARDGIVPPEAAVFHVRPDRRAITCWTDEGEPILSLLLPVGA